MSPFTCTRTRTTAALASAVLALTAGAQSASGADLRSPDARDAATLAQPPAPTDLRSPDARDAVLPSPIDLRTPDARDLASPPRHATTTASGADGGFTWGYLALGGAALALILGGAATTQHRRRVKRPIVAVRG